MKDDNYYEYVCQTCDTVFSELPKDALQICRSLDSRVTTYKFPNGTIHVLRRRAKKEN
jgi:hypothetical protein